MKYKYNPSDTTQLMRMPTSIIVQLLSDTEAFNVFVFGEYDDPDWDMEITLATQRIQEAMQELCVEINERVPVRPERYLGDCD